MTQRHSPSQDNERQLASLAPGRIFRHPYPFLRSRHTEMDEYGAVEIPCWRPGAAPTRTSNVAWVTDGVGEQRLTVVSTHKPGPYAVRVFYVQQWIDPDGKVFGKGTLRVCSLRKFLTLAQGYRYLYDLREQEATHATS